ncbi:cyclodeaminase/cyclohydrolase family protein [Streptomyces sp. NPDC007088]|uniref:cyclodeaminase/cyclohydrolase family protein n=1 Tax=Streptomyces sp. NPDC007088 TaxID=3364773 RepID=UPI0036CB162E
MPDAPTGSAAFAASSTGSLRSQSLDDYLHGLAARLPAPGGGAVAALHAAQAAALIGMVARYSTGPKYADHAPAVDRITTAADELRERALSLAEADAAAFTSVTEAYRLPKNDPREKAARSEAIAAALVAAANPPAETVLAAGEIVDLAEALLPVANPNVVSDIAAATEAARAAAVTGRVNIEINLSGIKDPDARDRLTGLAARVDDLAARADQMTREVRGQIANG